VFIKGVLAGVAPGIVESTIQRFCSSRNWDRAAEIRAVVQALNLVRRS
jgi:hypothetical protein